MSAPPERQGKGTGEPFALGATLGPLELAAPLVGTDGRAPGRLLRFAREKRWVYALAASNDALFALGVVRTGYGATAFGWLHRRGAKALVGERVVLGPALSGRVAASVHDPVPATFRAPGARVRLARPSSDRLQLEGTLGALAFDLVLDEQASPPPLSVIAATADGYPIATEKRGPLGVTGEVRVGTERFRFDGGLAGTDFSIGLPPRHTHWRWAMIFGRDRGGRAVCVNLVEGHIGAPECAVFVDGRVEALAEPRVSFDRAAPGTSPWRMESEGTRLTFVPEALHQQKRWLGPVNVKLLQAAGVWSGTIDTARGPVELDGALGVAEDQDSLW